MGSGLCFEERRQVEQLLVDHFQVARHRTLGAARNFENTARDEGVSADVEHKNTPQEKESTAKVSLEESRTPT